MAGSDRTRKSSTPAGAVPHYYGHRDRLRQRFVQAGSDALHDYEMLELILFRAIPRRDVKPLAKQLLETFGSFAEVIAAPIERLKEGDIVNVDVTLILDGWHGDSSRMFAVGAIPRRAERLIEVQSVWR